MDNMPRVTRDGTRADEMFTLGKVTSLELTVTYHYGDKNFTVIEIWDIPEEEHMYAEDWFAIKETSMPELVLRAVKETNIELIAIRQLMDYVNSVEAQ
jgi:hypothetical protein